MTLKSGRNNYKKIDYSKGCNPGIYQLKRHRRGIFKYYIKNGSTVR